MGLLFAMDMDSTSKVMMAVVFILGLWRRSEDVREWSTRGNGNVEGSYWERRETMLGS